MLAELSQRRWTAALTARNNQAWDILATRSNAFVRLRVKTKTTITDVFQWNTKKSGEIFLELSTCNDFCVLVDIPLDESGPTYYIVPTTTIDNWLKTDFQIWVSTPGRSGTAKGCG